MAWPSLNQVLSTSKVHQFTTDELGQVLDEVNDLGVISEIDLDKPAIAKRLGLAS